MPYVDKGMKICRPAEKKTEIKQGDIILIQPALLKVRGFILEFPPLSVISPDCENEIESPNWVEGYTVNGKEKVTFKEGKREVEGEIEVKCPRFLPAISLKHALGKVKLVIDDVEGIPILEIVKAPLLTISGETVTVATSQLKNYFKPLAYSLYYYVSPSGNSESS